MLINNKFDCRQQPHSLEKTEVDQILKEENPEVI